jgi:hypothetical protein
VVPDIRGERIVEPQGGDCKVVVADCKSMVLLEDHIADLVDRRDMVEVDQLAVDTLAVTVQGQEIAGLELAMEQSQCYYYQGVRTTLEEMVECL